MVSWDLEGLDPQGGVGGKLSACLEQNSWESLGKALLHPVSGGQFGNIHQEPQKTLKNT